MSDFGELTIQAMMEAHKHRQRNNLIWIVGVLVFALAVITLPVLALVGVL